MTEKISVLCALALIVVLAAPAFALAGETGQGAPSLQQDEAGDDEDPLDRWQREDDADHLEEKGERRQERRLDKQLDQKLDEQLGQPERE